MGFCHGQVAFEVQPIFPNWLGLMEHRSSHDSIDRVSCPALLQLARKKVNRKCVALYFCRCIVIGRTSWRACVDCRGAFASLVSRVHPLQACGHLVADRRMPGRYSHYLYFGVSLRSRKTDFEGSEILIDQIIRMTVQTGLATALCATIDLILFLSDPAGQ
ncbi:hypothetical protein C8J57DRAFT_226175 [Mycena rebaudengoi]|nr:hypothetical protein C8J57DRAFT_226175 [Mycena rebaudengoi]